MLPTTLILRLLIVLLTCGVATSSCGQTVSSSNLPAADVYTGSTPCDERIRSVLQLPADTRCEFIRWDLALTGGSGQAPAFALNIRYGEGQPNTTGFKGGGAKCLLKGKYHTSQSESGEVLHLSAEDPSTSFSLARLDDNLLHLLTPDGKLMVGNAGWSYTLSRKEASEPASSDLPALSPSPTLLNDTARQVIYEGRTPCQDLAREYGLSVSDDCFKLKWKLTLYRDPVMHTPSTYTLYWTLSRDQLIRGKWSIIKGRAHNADAVVYQLDPDQPQKDFSFLAGDRNVLFLLDKEGRLLKGDANFSYTLNRRE